MTRSKNIPTTNEVIREIFLAHGFKIPPELDDMRPYVYEAACALLRHYGVCMTDKPEAGKAIESEPAGIGYAHSTVAKGPTTYARSET